MGNLAQLCPSTLLSHLLHTSSQQANPSFILLAMVVSQLQEIKRLTKLYFPTLQSSLLSIGTFADRGHLVLFNSKHCFVMDHHHPNKVFLRGSCDPQKLSHFEIFYSPSTKVATNNLRSTMPSSTSQALLMPKSGYGTGGWIIQTSNAYSTCLLIILSKGYQFF